MLKVNKSISLNATSEIDGVQVAYMNATISNECGSANINKGINNQALYNANRSEVRKDMAEFEDEVYKVEDEMVKENTELVKRKGGK